MLQQFFSLLSFTISGILPVDKAIELMKAKATAKFSKKGDAIVAANHNGIERGSKELVRLRFRQAGRMLLMRKLSLRLRQTVLK